MPRRGENIRKRKDGRWEGRYMVITREGQKKYMSVYAKTYADVKTKRNIAKMKNTNLNDRRFNNICYADVVDEWLTMNQEEHKHSTYVKYHNICTKYILPAVQVITIPEDSSKPIQLKMDNVTGLSESMKRSIIRITHSIGTYAADKYDLPGLEAAINCKKVKSAEPEIFTDCEQKKLICALYQNMDIDSMGILLCLSTGIRLGEVCALKWTDFDLENGYLYINRTVQRIAMENESSRTVLMITPPKSVHSIRRIPLSQSILSVLEQFYPGSKDEYLWHPDKPLDPRTYQNRYHTCLKQAGVKSKNFHMLRHTFATNCITNSMDVKCLSEILGHADVKITMNRYVHPTMETKRQYMNALSAIYGQYLGQ